MSEEVSPDFGKKPKHRDPQMSITPDPVTGELGTTYNRKKENAVGNSYDSVDHKVSFAAGKSTLQQVFMVDVPSVSDERVESN